MLLMKFKNMFTRRSASIKRDIRPYWIHFIDHNPGCVEAENEENAKQIALKITGAEVTSCNILPYPADPRINKLSECPSFCYDAEHCKGRTSCPKRPACSE